MNLNHFVVCFTSIKIALLLSIRIKAIFIYYKIEIKFVAVRNLSLLAID